MKKKQIKTLNDFKDLCQFLAVNAHNLLIDAYIPGEQADKAAEFMKQCKQINEQLEKEKQ